MESTARLLLALFLSMSAIYLWNHYYVNPKIEKAEIALKQKQKELIEQEKLDSLDINSANSLDSLSGDFQVSEGLAIKKTSSKIISRTKLIKNDFSKNLRVKISTKDVEGSINLQGLLLDDLTLKNYNETLKNDSGKVVLLSPKNTKELYFLRSGWVSKGKANVKTPDENSLWKIISKNKILTENNPIELAWDNGEGFIFKQKISLNEKYLFEIQQSVSNNSGVNVSLSPFALSNRAVEERENVFISHEGAIAYAEDEIKEVKYSTLAEEGKQEFKKTKGWAGISDKYWLTSILPQDSSKGLFDIRFNHYRSNQKDRYQVDILGENFTLKNGEELNYKFNFFAGSKKLKLLEKYSKELDIKLFDRAIDFGIYYIITKPIMEALYFFNKYFNNLGLAIMALTICVRLLLFPVANKAYNSMARMRKHMPEIQRMKEKYKKDSQKLGVEMMKYYKEHKINPLSGCFPLFIQIPIFFSLYKVLYVTIEMRHAPFFGWIKDLSEKDPTNILNFFGLLPYDVPAWLPAIGILPILYTLTMILQQKLNPPPSDETQRIVMAWMPWIFLFVFASFASGLVIYWIWNNILSILQQWIITKRVEEDKKA
ncbi:MAG: membrane protein insertase YidC [Rickettsiales bacterium]|nr:membrane protein insertase YidC [Rickettsiales bacterium]